MDPHDSKWRDILEEENDTLRARVRMLEDALLGVFQTPVEWKLTGSERCVLGAISTREVATKQTIMTALYRDDGKDEPEIKIVDVFVCKLRRKLAPFGIDIMTSWGVGYYLSPASKKIIEGLTKDAAQRAA